MEHPDLFMECKINIDQELYEETLDAGTSKPSEEEESIFNSVEIIGIRVFLVRICGF